MSYNTDYIYSTSSPIPIKRKNNIPIPMSSPIPIKNEFNSPVTILSPIPIKRIYNSPNIDVKIEGILDKITEDNTPKDNTKDSPKEDEKIIINIDKSNISESLLRVIINSDISKFILN